MSTLLTEAQESIFAYMVRHQEGHGRPPSLREIRDEFGFSSVNAALKHVQALARKGRARQSGDGRAWSAVGTEEVQGHFFSVPIFGTIPAGFAVQNPQLAGEFIRIDPALFGLRSAKGLRALHVRGDSMTGAQIADGDIALLEDRPARPGDIVAALVDGESTLKRLVKEKQKTFLRAENPRYADIHPGESLVLQGVFVGVVGRGRR